MIEISPNTLWVAIGACALGASCGASGCLTFLQRQSLVGDVLAHAALPGVVLAFALLHSSSVAVLMGGALLSGLAAMLIVNFIRRNSRLSDDTALAFVLSWFFALGIVGLSYLQQTGHAQAGLERLFFGKAAALRAEDLRQLIVIALLVLGTLMLFRNRIRLILFDAIYAETLGIRRQKYLWIINLLLLLSICSGLHLVGVVLLAALLVIPPAASRLWTNSLEDLLMLSAVVGAGSGVLGTLISAQFFNLPTGPCIVLVSGAFFAFSACFSPTRGLLSRWQSHRTQRTRVAEENVLRAIYVADVSGHSKLVLGMAPRFVEKTLERLSRAGLVRFEGESPRLTEPGKIKAETLTRRHRLWELYLNRTLQLPADHAHENAELAEHILTPELEEQLATELGNPRKDPHGAPIPIKDVDNKKST